MKCSECIWWDVESDRRGFRKCLKIKSDMLGPTEELAVVEEAPCMNLLLLTRGEFGCVLFTSKR
jgi:hypothetical protein